MEDNFLSTFNKYKEDFDKKLYEVVESFSNSVLFDCIKYSLFTGGKRIRPLFYLEAIKAFGGEICENDYLVACAIELLHTYTLVHDDLPCMDNDDYRRGQLTVHKKFDEVSALLTGDALQAAAFELLIKVANNNKNYINLMQDFVYYAGINGVIDGQAIELRYPKNIKDNIWQIYLKKTSALLTAPLVMAADIAGVDVKLKDKLIEFGTSFGYAFQLSDDILDVNKDKEVSYATCFGKEKAQAELNKYSLLAIELAKETFTKPQFFVDISQFIVERNY